MKFIKFLFIVFITLPSTIKADLNEDLLKELNEGGKLVFIRHAYAPGVGDPVNFDIKDCDTQRNLNNIGRAQAKRIGDFFLENKIPIYKVFSSEWCRCKETAHLAFENYETRVFLNSFYSSKFAKNKKFQMLNLEKYINNWNEDKNLVLITHYVVISEVLNYAPSSGEIVVSDNNFKIIGNIEIDY